MKRILSWHVPQIRGDSGSQGVVHYAEADYAPGAMRLYARKAPDGGDLTVDVRADGVSIFTSNYAALNKGANLEENAEDYPGVVPEISEGAAISLHIISSGNAEDISAHLEVESLDQNDETDASE